MSTVSNNKIKLLGAVGEEVTVRYLEKNGFTILAKNYRIRGGEVDIIATKQELLVFVEVKTRREKTHYLSEVVTLAKQKKIIFAAHYFIAKTNPIDKAYRFDIALIQGTDLKISYIENAFTPSE